LLCQLIVWLIIQLLCHEWYLFFDKGLMGDAKGKIEYFRNETASALCRLPSDGIFRM